VNTTLEKPDNKKSNNSSLDIIEFDSRSLEQDHVFDFWREGVKPIYCGLKNALIAGRSVYHFGSLQVAIAPDSFKILSSRIAPKMM